MDHQAAGVDALGVAGPEGWEEPLRSLTNAICDRRFAASRPLARGAAMSAHSIGEVLALAGNRPVRVVPVGAMGLAPVEGPGVALGGQRLVRWHPTLVPLRRTGHRAGVEDHRGVVVSADADVLPGAAREARAVAGRLRRDGMEVEVLGGSRGLSRATVLAAMKHAGHVHFATHATFDATHPAGSCISLGPGDGVGDEVRLTVADVLASRCRGRVVLSACETARVDAERIIEPVGLAAAFVGAGAETCVATRLKIEDRVHAATRRTALAWATWER